MYSSFTKANLTSRKSRELTRVKSTSLLRVRPGATQRRLVCTHRVVTPNSVCKNSLTSQGKQKRIWDKREESSIDDLSNFDGNRHFSESWTREVLHRDRTSTPTDQKTSHIETRNDLFDQECRRLCSNVPKRDPSSSGMLKAPK